MKQVQSWQASNGHLFRTKRDAQREEMDILLQEYCESGAITPSVGAMIDCMMARPGAFMEILKDVEAA